MDYRTKAKIALAIVRINPFLPSLGMVLGIDLMRSLLSSTDLKELSGLLFYAEIYFVYQLSRLALEIMFEVVFSTDAVDPAKSKKGRIEESAATVSRLLFIEYVVLHITQDTVGRALVHQSFSSLMFWGNIGFIFWECRQWSEDITSSLAFRFPKIKPKLHFVESNKIGFLSLPFILVTVLGYDLFKVTWSYLSTMDLVKRLLSEVFRKRLERVESSGVINTGLPQEYLAPFDYYLPAENELFVERKGAVGEQLGDLVLDWVHGRTQGDLTLVVGDRGMGKSTILSQVSKLVPCEHRLIGIPQRLLSSKGLFNWITGVLGSPISGLSDLEAWDLDQKSKIVVFVDDIQNLFLGVVDGFDAYRNFIRVLSLPTKNIHWCLSVNLRSWAYLKGVFGAEHFYGKVLTIPAWKDHEIQRLILARHQTTGFGRVFDESIGKGGADRSIRRQVEGQFFRLLWGQSRGNPRSSIFFWISALSYPGKTSVHVGVPAFLHSALVSSLSDHSLFLLGAITRFESLSLSELERVTQIVPSVIRHCMSEAQDKGLVWEDSEGYYRISARAQHPLDSYLIGKNFLYE